MILAQSVLTAIAQLQNNLVATRGLFFLCGKQMQTFVPTVGISTWERPKHSKLTTMGKIIIAAYYRRLYAKSGRRRRTNDS